MSRSCSGSRGGFGVAGFEVLESNPRFDPPEHELGATTKNDTPQRSFIGPASLAKALNPCCVERSFDWSLKNFRS